MRKKIIYAGNFGFPNQNAAGIRVLMNGRLFHSIGYDVIYCGLSKNTGYDESNIDKLNAKTFENFIYYESQYPRKLKDWLFFWRAYKKTASLIISEKPDIVILYGSPSSFIVALLLTLLCKRENIKVISDCVDWLSGGSGSVFFRFAKWIDTEIHKRLINSMADGVIVVSTFLRDYYVSKRCKTIIIPPLSMGVLDDRVSTSSCGHSDVINLVYAGNPFPLTRRLKSVEAIKDRLDVAIEILYRVKQVKFKFNIYGISKEQYLSVIPNHISIINELGDVVEFHGQRSNAEVKNKIFESDYFFLVRDKNKMNDAGFPSKISEAIGLGTPVICTDTSDLKNYLEEGVMAHYLTIGEWNVAVEKLEAVFGFARDKAEEMSSNCLNGNPFGLQNFESSASIFLDDILRGG